MNAKLVTEWVTANFADELKDMKLSEMFDCFEVTDRRTLMHMRRNH